MDKGASLSSFHPQADPRCLAKLALKKSARILFAFADLLQDSLARRDIVDWMEQ